MAEDIPQFGDSRIAAYQTDVDQLCLYVPAGGHTLKISMRWGPKPAKPGQTEQNGDLDEIKNWAVSLRPKCGYLLWLIRDKRSPLRWELTCNDPKFASQSELVLDGPIQDRGYSWTGTEVLQFPNQLPFTAVYKSEDVLEKPPGLRVMNGVLDASREDQPYRLAFEVHLHSDAPPCIFANEVQSLFALGLDGVVGPMLGRAATCSAAQAASVRLQVLVQHFEARRSPRTRF